MSKRAIMQMAMQIAKKRKMAMGGNVEGDDEEDYETPMSLQERGEYHPEEMGGSDELAKALLEQMSGMAYGGMVEPELQMHSPNATPGQAESVPAVVLKDSDLTEEAKMALADKKKRRRFK